MIELCLKCGKIIPHFMRQNEEPQESILHIEKCYKCVELEQKDTPEHGEGGERK